MISQLIHNENGQINIVLNENNKYKEKPHVNESKDTVKRLAVIDHYFSSFIGLDDFKHIVKEIYAIHLVNQKRKEFGLKANKQVLHMLFKGNPGTGKTTVARRLATLLHELDVLSKGHFIEAERADLVGEYIGQTAQKTKKLIQKARGGVLFIDEAYSLARGGDKDFGREAIDCLVKYMEDYHEELIVILAGYPDEMDYFLQLNPGLTSRFPFIINFSNYSPDQLLKIAKHMAHDKQYDLSKDAVWTLKHHITKEIAKSESHFSNGRYVRNMIENMIRRQAMRLMYKSELDIKDLTTLIANDIAKT